MKTAALVMSMVAAATVAAQEWTPAPGPLLTRWGSAVDPQRVLPEHPRPQMVREDWLNLNGVWEFAPAAEGEAPPFGRALAGRILVPFCLESALSGVGQRHERAWYRRTFRVPDGWRSGASERVLLHLGAVDWQAQVYINGRHMIGHAGGYDPFTVDITAALQMGDGEQELVVRVTDPTDAGTQPRGKQVAKPGGIWYTPVTGIWQTVWIERVPSLWIEGLKVEPSLKAGTVDVSIDLNGVHGGSSPMVRAEVMLDGKLIAEATAAGDGHAVVRIPDPKAWSPERPFLYDLRVTLLDGQTPMDSVGSYFGLRDASLGIDERGRRCILLNGEPLFQVGLLDQGYWPDGLYTAPSDEALRFDLEQAKALGFNMVRKHVKVEPQRWYYHADRLGLLVWQDMPSGDAYIGPGDPDITRTPESGAQFEAELAAMIENLRNHPSIIMWVPFNEGWGQWETGRITRVVKALDPSRLVNSASGWTDRGTGDVNDIHVYPGPGAPPAEEHRAGVLGEFGGLGLGVDGHTWAPRTWGYQGVADQQALTDRFVELLRRCWGLRDEPGLSAIVYTQLTDVETECNGLLTYDRAVLKVDPESVLRANRGEFPPIRVIVPTAAEAPAEWEYTFQDPGQGWTTGAPSGVWKRGRGGFGTAGTPGAVVGTVWDGPTIWIRRTIEVPAADEPRLLIHHDEDAEVFINGVPGARLEGYTTAYEMVRLSPEALATLRPGANLIAIRCTQTRGGQYIDAGLAAVGN